MGVISVKVADDREILIVHRDQGSDVPVIHQIWAARAYDPNRLKRWSDLQDQLNRIANRGKRPLIIDAGANIGASSLFFASFFDRSHVLAVEPEQQNFALLSHNARQVDNIRCIHGAISAQTGTFGVFDPQLDHVGFRSAKLPEEHNDEHWTGATVDAYSMRDLMEMAPPDAEPFMVKIDIEGGESDLFSKNTSWIDLFPVMIVELHDWMLPASGSSRNFLCAVAATGRDFVQIGENTFSIRN